MKRSKLKFKGVNRSRANSGVDALLISARLISTKYKEYTERRTRLFILAKYLGHKLFFNSIQ